MNLVKLQVTELIDRNLLHIYTLKKKHQKEKSKKEFYYHCIKKNKIPRDKHTYGDERPILQKL